MFPISLFSFLYAIIIDGKSYFFTSNARDTARPGPVPVLCHPPGARVLFLLLSPHLVRAVYRSAVRAPRPRGRTTGICEDGLLSPPSLRRINARCQEPQGRTVTCDAPAVLNCCCTPTSAIKFCKYTFLSVCVEPCIPVFSCAQTEYIMRCLSERLNSVYCG